MSGTTYKPKVCLYVSIIFSMNQLCFAAIIWIPVDEGAKISKICHSQRVEGPISFRDWIELYFIDLSMKDYTLHTHDHYISANKDGEKAFKILDKI